MHRVKKTRLAVSSLSFIVGGCSPYLYAPELKTFSTSATALHSTQTSIITAQTAVAEQLQLAVAEPERLPYTLTDPCGWEIKKNAGTCEAMDAITLASRARAAAKAPSVAAPALAANGGIPTASDAPPLASVSGCPIPNKPKRTQAEAPNFHDAESIGRINPNRIDIMAALDAYAAALAKITNAKDRAEFDAGSIALATAASAMVGLVAGPIGSGAAVVSQVIFQLAHYGVAVSFDQRRYHVLRCTVIIADPVVQSLVSLVGSDLDNRNNLLIIADLALANEYTSFMQPGHLVGTWKENALAIQVLAADIQARRTHFPSAAAASMGKAHASLAAALRTDDGRQLTDVAGEVATFATDSAAVSKALDKPAAVKSTVTKS